MAEGLLQGRIALITGASRGIGRATAELFAAHGASLVLSGRHEGLQGLTESLQQGGASVVAVAADLREGDCARKLVTACKEKFGRLDILVNNAGVLNQGLLGMTLPAAVTEMFEVNILAMMAVTQYAVRLMGKSSAPAVVNLTSMAGTHGLEGMSAYSASKAAVVGFTLSLAKELGPKGIRVNAVSPGLIDSDMTANMSPEVKKKRVESIRLGRSGTPADVAKAILFLASPLSDYITGQVLGVDGGLLM